MDLRGAGKTRRWQSTIAVVAVLSLFVALIVGSSLRPQFAAAALPEPAAWTQGTRGVQAHAGNAAAQSMSYLDHAFSPGCTPTNKTNKKPFHSTWMTRDRPTSSTPLSSQLGWLALPAPFAAPEFQPRGAHWAESAAALVNRDMLTQLCITRC